MTASTSSGPLLLGLPAVGVTLLTLGMAYVGLPHGTLGSVVPAVVLVMGLLLLGATMWAAREGQGLLASAFGMLSALGWSTAALLLGLFHNWYHIPPANVASAEELFFLAWAALFFFMVLPALRLSPAIGSVLTFVMAFLVLVDAGVFAASGTLLMAGGASALAAALVSLFAWLRAAMSETGLRLGGVRVHLAVSRTAQAQTA